MYKCLLLEGGCWSRELWKGRRSFRSVADQWGHIGFFSDLVVYREYFGHFLLPSREAAEQFGYVGRYGDRCGDPRDALILIYFYTCLCR